MNSEVHEAEEERAVEVDHEAVMREQRSAEKARKQLGVHGSLQDDLSDSYKHQVQHLGRSRGHCLNALLIELIHASSHVVR